MPTKKTTTKPKTVKKEVKATETKIDNVKKEIGEEIKFVKKEGTEIASKISKRWEKSSNEEKIYTALGIVALIWGLILLRHMIWGLLLIIIGVLFVTGYFVKKD